MFKTIQECRLDLVSYTQGNPYVYIMSNEEPSNRLAQRDMDFMPCSAARVSFGNEDKTGQDRSKDVKLMRYLADHKHMTPFEYQHATFLIECPLFIRSQIHRHRTFSYNEISRRYTDENLEFWMPDQVRGQSTSNRQASEGVIDSKFLVAWSNQAKESKDRYEALLEEGVARELARAVLPQSLLTKFYMGGNLRNWAHFIELRRDEHAQLEVQVIATRIADKLRELWPESCSALGI